MADESKQVRHEPDETAEDAALVRAIQEGEASGRVSPEEVRRALRARYDAALAEVPDVEPEERDRL